MKRAELIGGQWVSWTNVARVRLALATLLAAAFAAAPATAGWTISSSASEQSEGRWFVSCIANRVVGGTGTESTVFLLYANTYTVGLRVENGEDDVLKPSMVVVGFAPTHTQSRPAADGFNTEYRLFYAFRGRRAETWPAVQTRAEYDDGRIVRPPGGVTIWYDYPDDFLDSGGVLQVAASGNGRVNEHGWFSPTGFFVDLSDVGRVAGWLRRCAERHVAAGRLDVPVDMESARRSERDFLLSAGWNRK